MRHALCMDTLTPTQPQRLLLSRREYDGAHTADLLKTYVNRGQLIRLQRGCYFPTRDWLRSPPWERHLIAASAAGLANPEAIFCRETALALHGVPLLRRPDDVDIRTRHNRQTGRKSALASTGSASPQTLAKVWAEAFGEPPRGSSWASRLKTFGVKRHQVPLPLRLTMREGLHPETADRYYRGLQRVTPPAGEFFNPGELVLTVEPLPLAIVDAVCQMDYAAAVVVLDAVLAGRYRGPQLNQAGPFSQWLDCIPSGRARIRWDEALAFADPLAESPGESLSRVVIAQLGFQVPSLQHEISLPDGRRARTDFWWRSAGVVGEFDGMIKYSRARELSGTDTSEVVVAERRRERSIEEQGARLVRWGWAELSDLDRMHTLLLRAGVPRA